MRGGYRCGKEDDVSSACSVARRVYRASAVVFQVAKRPDNPNRAAACVVTGCGGNRNNFKSRRQCERKCEPSNRPIMIVDCQDPTDPSSCAFTFNTADSGKAAFTKEDLGLPDFNRAEFNVKDDFKRPSDFTTEGGSVPPIFSKEGLMPNVDVRGFNPGINKEQFKPSLGE